MNITIREWRLSDAKDLAVALSNPKILNNLRDGLPYPYTEQDGENFIRYLSSEYNTGEHSYAVCDDDRAIGNISVMRKTNVERFSAEIGYYLAEEYWGKGIMTSVVKEVCQKTFRETDIARIYGEVYSTNAGSRRVLEKVGFTQEGRMRNAAFKNGDFLDVILYALLKGEEKE